jgi:hypothetical protein
MVQNALSSTVNLSSSYLNHDLGWRWYYWVFAITVGAGLIFAYFGAFETQFARPMTSIDGQVMFTDEFGVTRVVPDSEAQEFLANMAESNNAVQLSGVRKSYLERIRPWSKPQPRPCRIILKSWLQMLESLTSPGILYAVMTSAVALGCGVGMSLTYNAVLIQSYGWREQDVGLINIGGVIGSILGMLYCTFIGGPFVLWKARRNRGFHIPEHRLITMIPPAIIGVGMLLLFGFTASGGATWWGPYIGWTIFQFTFTAIIIESTTFASEVAPKNPGPALVVVVGTKNIVSFGLTYGLNPMIARYGYSWAFGVLAGVFGAIFLFGFPVYWLNPKWRAYLSKKEAKTSVGSSA